MVLDIYWLFFRIRSGGWMMDGRKGDREGERTRGKEARKENSKERKKNEGRQVRS